MLGGVHCRRLASVQSACHAVERAAQALHEPLQEGFLQQAYTLLILKLRAACQLRMGLVRPLPLPLSALHLAGLLMPHSLL